MRRARVLVLLFAACGLPHSELFSNTTAGTTTTKPTWTKCDEALGKAQLGDACAGITSCVSTTTCCKEALTCEGQLITAQKRDCSACPACTSDDACPAGEWCTDGTCAKCVEAVSCPPCPGPFVPFLRHGCATCDCGPVVVGCDSCPGQCFAGAYCTQCSTGSCCLESCGDKTCGPNPLGCVMDCGAQSCAVCSADACVCTDGKWSCKPQCAEPLKAYVQRCQFAP